MSKFFEDTVETDVEYYIPDLIDKMTNDELDAYLLYRYKTKRYNVDEIVNYLQKVYYDLTDHEKNKIIEVLK